MRIRSTSPAALLGLGVVLLAACTSTTGGHPTGPTNSPSASHPSARTPATSGTTGTGGPTAGPTTAQSSSATPLRTMSVTADDGTRYRVQVWAEDHVTDCAAHSYGQVVQYFQQHPCRSASRRLVTLNFNGKTVAMSAISVICASGPEPDHVYDYAAQFARMELADGTGGINDLLREGFRGMPGPTTIPPNEAFDVQSQDVGVFVMDAWYVDGPTRSQDPGLIALEQNFILTAVTN